MLLTTSTPPRLLDQMRATMLQRGLRPRTIDAYAAWVKRFILFHQKQHPRLLGVPEIRTFLTALSRESGVSPTTQNQARAALLFLYEEVLHCPLPELATLRAASVFCKPEYRPSSMPNACSDRQATTERGPCR